MATQKVLEDIRDVFNIFHDGSIVEFSGDKNRLRLKIGCQYLAERIDKNFEFFHIELQKINKLKFDAWMHNVDLPSVCFIEMEQIFAAELEILSAEIKADFVEIACSQHDPEFDYCGGVLSLSCEEICVFDQGGNIVTVERLGKICKEYWEEWANAGAKREEDR